MRSSTERTQTTTVCSLCFRPSCANPRGGDGACPDPGPTTGRGRAVRGSRREPSTPPRPAPHARHRPGRRPGPACLAGRRTLDCSVPGEAEVSEAVSEGRPRAVRRPERRGRRAGGRRSGGRWRCDQRPAALLPGDRRPRDQRPGAWLPSGRRPRDPRPGGSGRPNQRHSRSWAGPAPALGLAAGRRGYVPLPPAWKASSVRRTDGCRSRRRGASPPTPPTRLATSSRATIPRSDPPAPSAVGRNRVRPPPNAPWPARAGPRPGWIGCGRAAGTPGPTRSGPATAGGDRSGGR
jgi:hypothetical protein